MPRRWMLRLAAPALGASVLAVGLLPLAGCTEASPPYASPVPLETRAPLFASNADALAAATIAYERYMEVVDAILHDGGADPDRITTVADGEAVTDIKSSALTVQSRREHLVGRTRVDSMRIQQLSQSPDHALIFVYACQDFTSTDYLDASGVSIVDPEGQARIPVQVQLEGRSQDGLKVIRDEVWRGANFC